MSPTKPDQSSIAIILIRVNLRLSAANDLANTSPQDRDGSDE